MTEQKPFTKLSELFAHLEAGGMAVNQLGTVIEMGCAWPIWCESRAPLDPMAVYDRVWHPYVKPKKYRPKTLTEMKAEGVIFNSYGTFIHLEHPDTHLSGWSLLYFSDKPELSKGDLSLLPTWAVKEIEE